jgi:hypothetical protein
MAIKLHTNGNILAPLTEDGNCCCSCLGYCCINGDCVDLNPALGLTCQACKNAGGECHCSLTKTCANQDDCDCSVGSGAAGTGGSYCVGSGYGVTLV